jgi:hypothetical protein
MGDEQQKNWMDTSQPDSPQEDHSYVERRFSRKMNYSSINKKSTEQEIRVVLTSSQLSLLSPSKGGSRSGKARSEQQILELTSGNGAKPPALTSNQTGNSGPQAVKAPDDTSNPPKARKIERAAHRDPVGTTAHEETTTKCVFSGGVTEISVRKMRDAGVLKVECPECLSMRGLTPQGETVQFPSHNPRKTRTPNREARWVKREQAWELAGR